MTLNGRNVTLAEINNISGAEIRSESKSAQSTVAVSVNKIRVNSLYRAHRAVIFAIARLSCSLKISNVPAIRSFVWTHFGICLLRTCIHQGNFIVTLMIALSIKKRLMNNLVENITEHDCFYRAMLAQSAVMRLHVDRLSVRNDQVPCSNRFEFFENNFTAK